jgi:ABC-type nitrate/sulfonate/bicarbonate transport system permease component
VKSLVARAGSTLAGLLMVWQVIVTFGELPPYILPDPWAVAYQYYGIIAGHCSIMLE